MTHLPISTAKKIMQKSMQEKKDKIPAGKTVKKIERVEKKDNGRKFYIFIAFYKIGCYFSEQDTYYDCIIVWMPSPIP